MNSIVYFGADWCRPCKEFRPTLDKLDSSRVTRYDVDVNVEERKKYEISAVPTIIIVNSEGIEVERFLGGASLETLSRFLNE